MGREDWKIGKKIHGRVKIWGWSKKQDGTFTGSKLVVDSKNVHILYVWWSLSTARHHLRKKNKKFHKFLPFFNLTVKSDLQTYKTCTFLESSSNLIPEKVSSCFLDQPKILTLPWIFFSNFSIHGPFARGRSQNFKQF
jgi:hypothetical protein